MATTHIKLRPLMMHDSASSQTGFSDACGAEVSPPLRTHRALAGANSRGGSSTKMVPAPPDSGSSSVGEDTGVSKLRSKLRRLLGAHSSSNSSSNGASPGQKMVTTPSQTAALRCASTADLHDRPAGATAAGGGRAAASVPVSPSVAVSGGGHRGRFAGSAIIVPGSASVASTPPATPGSVISCGGSAVASPAGGSVVGLHGSCRAGPVPPATAAPNAAGSGSGGAAAARCPSASSGRSPSLRRAVSFSPNATTFPPLGSPNLPSPPAAPNGSGSGSGMLVVAAAAGGGAGGAATRPGLVVSNSLVAVGGRTMSNMVVVPEDEALPEDAGQGGDYTLPLSAGSIVAMTVPPPPPSSLGAPRAALGHGLGHPLPSSEYVFRNGRISAGDPDCLPLALASPPPAATAATASPYDASQRPTASSSNSSSSVGLPTTSASGYADAGPHVTSAPAPMASAAVGLASWSSDAANGPFQAAAVAAAMALLEPPPSPSLSTSSSSYNHQQVRTPPLKSLPRNGGGAASDTSRPLSSSSSAAAAAVTAAGGAATSASPRGATLHHQQHHHHHLPTAAAAAAAAGHSHATFTPTTAQPALPNHASVPPPLTRGMSAFNLMIGGGAGGGSRGGANSSSSPWNAVAAGAGVSVLPPAASAAAVGPTVAAALPPTGAPEAPSTPAVAACKNPPIRRAHSTIDNVTRSQPEAPSGPPGVLMALGASLPTEMKRKEWRVEDFTMLKRLYKGNYSAVHKALCRISMRLVVIKTYDTTRMTELARNHVKREATLHAPLEHDNILNLYAVFSQGPYVMLVEEVAEGGDLYHVLKSIPGHRLQEDRAVAGVLVPLLRSLAYLHEQGICHRDIKLENILFSDRQHTRMLLADFGIALSLRQERAVTRAGTTEYMSPEQLRCPFKRHPGDNKDRTDLHYGLGVDVWATGVLAFELLHGYPPFLGAHREETEHLILTAEVQVAPQLSHGARDFVLSCLSKDPADRPTVMQLLQHSWVRQHMRQLRP